MQTVISHLEEHSALQRLRRDNGDNAELVRRATISEDESLTPEVVRAMMELWQDPLIREKVAASNTFQLNDSAP